MAPSLNTVQTLTQRSYDWIKKSVRPAPEQPGAPQWMEATAWNGPWSTSDLPGSGPIQAQSDYVIGMTLHQNFWRNNENWLRTIPIEGDAPNWSAASSWDGPYPISALPGSGDIQLLADFVSGMMLYQEFWRGWVGYRRAVPIVGDSPDWASAMAWSPPIPTSELAGSGALQTLNCLVFGGQLRQDIWRGNQGWWRTIPLFSNGTPNWVGASSWAGPIPIGMLPGNGDMQMQSDFIIGNTLHQNFWRGFQGWSRSVPIGSSQNAVSMYRALPLTAKVPPGYSIPNATGDCHYVRHLGSEFKIGGTTYPGIALHSASRSQTSAFVQAEVGPWPDGQPSLWFAIDRAYDTSTGKTTVDVYYYGKPVNDTREYPIKLFWGPVEILADHRINAGYIYHGEWNAADGQLGNKYFLRTEDQVALKLLQGEPDNWKLNDWCGNQWIDTHADIHAPLFNAATNKPNDFMYQPGQPAYLDCTKSHDGCPSDWPADLSRLPATGWGFSHRSKVCIWPEGYTWVLAQDPLGLLAQAVHTLITTNNPWANITNVWPPGAVVPAPNAFTPIGIAQWVIDHFWTPGIGVHMFQVPVIGQDSRASSLRTNQFLILTTLLGYRFLIGGWANIADQVADILAKVSIGGPNQPAYGIRTNDMGDICRPDYYGAQLYVWDFVSGSNLGLMDFGWLRQTINHYLNLPPDDEDFILSTVETTATYCQAWRVYGYHKYMWQFGPLSTIPGH